MHTKTLDEIGLSAGKGGDKASDAHDYLRRYEPFFEHMRHEPIRLLEIGIEKGFSANIWLEYFPNATIFGVDILPCPGGEWPERFKFMQGDQTSTDFWNVFLGGKSAPFDIIIDDGCHKAGGTITSFEMLFPSLRSGGYYIIEDLSTAYMAGYQDEWQNMMGFIGDLLNDINAQLKYRPPHWEPLSFPPGTNNDRGIDWMQISEELAIIKKK